MAVSLVEGSILWVTRNEEGSVTIFFDIPPPEQEQFPLISTT
jgi:hypothetical protein